MNKKINQQQWQLQQQRSQEKTIRPTHRYRKRRLIVFAHCQVKYRGETQQSKREKRTKIL